MGRKSTLVERALAEYLRSTEPGLPDTLSEMQISMEMEGDDSLNQQVEIAYLPGYAKSNLDDMYIQYVNNTRVGAQLYPDQNLRRYFELINIHPMDVLVAEHFAITPVAEQSYWTDEARVMINRQNAAYVQEYLKLLTNFEVDPTRPALCTAEIARIIFDNVGYGGVPIIAGWARVSDILELDFEQEVEFSGRYQVGIYDTLNGSGHMECATEVPFKRKIDKGDLFVCSTKGWTPNGTFGFVGRYYQLDLATAKEATPV